MLNANINIVMSDPMFEVKGLGFLLLLFDGSRKYRLSFQKRSIVILNQSNLVALAMDLRGPDPDFGLFAWTFFRKLADAIFFQGDTLFFPRAQKTNRALRSADGGA